MIYWINAMQPDLVATRAAHAGAVPANTTGFVALASGAEGTTENADWQTAFDNLEPVAVSFIVPMTGDAAIHPLLATHVKAITNGGLLPRLGFIGGVAGEKTTTLDTLLTRSRGLNSDLMVHCTPGFYMPASGGGAPTLAW